MSQGVTAERAEDDLMAPGEAARMLRVHRATLGRWATATPPLIASTVLPSGHRRYPRAAVEAIRGTAGGEAR